MAVRTLCSLWFNLDPYNTVEGEVLLNLPAVGLPGNADAHAR